MEQAKRRALNESVFRQVNEQIEKLAGRQDRLEIVCECDLLACAQPLPISQGAYRDARQDPRTFIVAPGHTDRSIEIVLAERDDYVLVQKIGDAGEMATITSPR